MSYTYSQLLAAEKMAERAFGAIAGFTSADERASLRTASHVLAEVRSAAVSLNAADTPEGWREAKARLVAALFVSPTKSEAA